MAAEPPSVLCDVCGRDNPERLTFCQDCGKRLRPATGPQPTATLQGGGVGEARPSGGPPPRPSEAPRDGRSDVPPSIGRRASRPEAPPLAFVLEDVRFVAEPEPMAPNPSPESATAPVPHDAASGATSSPRSTCVHCGATNPPTHRFCTTCGGTIGGAPRPVATPSSSSLEVPAPVAPAPAVVAAPVVAISLPLPGAAATVTCTRCQGQCAASARYCKYCGATLAASPDAPSTLDPPTLPPHTQAPHAVPAPAVGPAAPVVPAPIPSPWAAVSAPGQLAHAPATTAAPHLGAPPAPPGSAPGVAIARPSGSLALTPPPSAAPIEPEPVTTRGAPRLVVLRDDGSEGASFPLNLDVVDLGRREGDILLHDDLYVSPRHARFRREGDRVRIIDLASTNGIYLRLRAPLRLSTGNLILLGLEVLQFQLVKDAETPASPLVPSASAPRPRPGAAGADVDTTLAGGRSPAASSPQMGAPSAAGFLGQAMQHGTLVFGSPAAPRRASLHQRTVEGIVRDVHHLVRDEVILGREGADIVFSADPYMSRRHAVIRRDPATDVYTLTDLDSSNGTFVRIENDTYLGHGDEIRIGRHLFRFDAAGGGEGARGHARGDALAGGEGWAGGEMLSGRARAGSA